MALTGNTVQIPVTIREGQTESDPIHVNGGTITSIDIPAGTEGANLSFIHNDLTYHDMDDAPVSIPITAESSRAMDTSLFAAMGKLVLVTDVAQADDDATLMLNVAHFSN
jgi:hypothetical protein